MIQIMPQFLDMPVNGWVKCEQVEDLPGREVACTVQGLNQIRIIILPTSNDIVDNRVRAYVIGYYGDNGKLVDFPSGDRVLMAADAVETSANGRTV